MKVHIPSRTLGSLYWPQPKHQDNPFGKTREFDDPLAALMAENSIETDGQIK